MARDADGAGPVVFDLVDDDGSYDDAPVVVPGGPAGPGAGPGEVPPEAGDPLSGGPGRRLRTLMPVAAVLAVVLGTGFAVDGVRAAERIERIREAPGGVVDVSSPLGRTWTWTPEAGADELAGEMMLADLEGLLAFLSEGELVALDPASGEEVWSLPLGEDAACGPTGYAGAPGYRTSGLVCLQGGAADREAVTVGPDGVVSESRRLDPADDRRYGEPLPGPEGTVLRAKRLGPGSAVDVGDARCSETNGECSGTVEAGRDLLLRAEDAVTGDERWSMTIPFRATAAQGCTPWFGYPWSGWEVPAEETLAPDMFGARIGAELVDVWGCGVSASVTPGGVLLRTEGLTGSGSGVAFGDGRYGAVTATDGAPRTALFASDGTVVGEILGFSTGPRTTDGLDEPTLLAGAPTGTHLRSYTTDGSLRWEVAVRPEAGTAELVAQVGGTLVTNSWTSGFAGLDLATGAERWSWKPGELLDDLAYGLGYVAQTFTDGRSVLLPVQSDSGAVELMSVDATSGELVWNRPLADVVGPGQDVLLAAVGGHLLAITPEGITGLG